MSDEIIPRLGDVLVQACAVAPGGDRVTDVEARRQKLALLVTAPGLTAYEQLGTKPYWTQSCS